MPSAPSLTKLKRALRPTSGSKVQRMVRAPSSTAHARCASLSGTPSPRSAAASTEYTSLVSGGPNTATQAPASRSPSNAACTAPPAWAMLCSVSGSKGGAVRGVCHTSLK